MTTKTATPVANIKPTEAGDLSTRGDSASFFAVTPVKGARVEGTFAVGMTLHELEVDRRRPGVKAAHPAMWVDFTPIYDRTRNGAHEATRAPMTINGRTYGAATFESINGYVECYPVSQYAHLVDYGYPVMTIDGAEYVLRFRLQMFDTVTDSAHKLLEAVANAIAVDYLTDVRWATYRRDSAKRSASNAADELNEAQAKYDAAQAAFDAASARLLDAINAADK